MAGEKPKQRCPSFYQGQRCDLPEGHARSHWHGSIGWMEPSPVVVAQVESLAKAMGVPAEVQRLDGTTVPLNEWALEAVEKTVRELEALVGQACVESPDKPEPTMVARPEYYDFGQRALPLVLAVVRQVPAVLERLRAAEDKVAAMQRQQKMRAGFPPYGPCASVTRSTTRLTVWADTE